LFAENTITINKSLKLTPGLRLESIVSEVEGKFNSANPQNETDLQWHEEKNYPTFWNWSRI
jgi:outer membrane receptor for Fe3+-dicitrate